MSRTTGADFRLLVDTAFGFETRRLVEKRLDIYRQIGQTRQRVKEKAEKGDGFDAFLLGLAYFYR